MTFAEMKQIALGRMRYRVDEFGLMRPGDFFDALTGFLNGENNHIKKIAGLIRNATAILWNVQVDKKHKLTAEELWPFEWDEKADVKGIETMPDEERIKIENAQERIIDKM